VRDGIADAAGVGDDAGGAALVIGDGEFVERADAAADEISPGIW
jgi:hypothetical protein